MKKFTFSIAALLLAVTGSVFAQNTSNGVTVSRDPAKAAAIEQRAADIKAARSQTVVNETPAALPIHRHGKKHHAKHHGKRHHAKHHHGKRHHKHHHHSRHHHAKPAVAK